MFKKARLNLTGWYLLIIMLVSTLFSLTVYQESTTELGRGLRLQALRFAPREQLETRMQQATASATFAQKMPTLGNGQPLSHEIDIKVFEEAKRRIALQLILINLGILVISGFAAYFLAGRTLKPIEEALDEQKRFISDASHELRTPLTALKTEIEVALRDKKLNLRQARELLDSNLEEVDKMQSLSNYLLSLSRYQNSDLKLKFEHLKAVEIIEKAITRVEKLAANKNIKINQEIEDFKLEGNSTGLVEIITILLDNAIKYSPKESSVLIKSYSDQRHAYFSVADSGIGIKASDIPYIFNRFYRADTSRSKTHVEGYGLGLSIAKSIVDIHYGKISVESTPNEGSIFTITLPLRQSKRV